MNGKLIVIEGSNGSGKSTQQELLVDRLQAAGVRHRRIRFPRYENESSALIRMYLGGAFGQNPDDVNPYAASTFFAVDRFASYATDWREDYLSGCPIICDRYTTSNAIHQASKLDGEQAARYLDWLFDFEYQKLGIPKPDLVLYLDLPTEAALKQLASREGATRDIHELDAGYLARCRETALSVCDRYGWVKVDCLAGGKLRPRQDISDEIAQIVLKELRLGR